MQISFGDKWTVVRLSDSGIGLSEIDKQHLNVGYKTVCKTFLRDTCFHQANVP
ncbi:hypothetical protein [Bacteroides acidifaciens]|uniref:hypothetical protein n=1 Tax=Bacteroides acidifaciens TaxID=85831 RepID=UPI003C6C6DE2